MLVVKNDKPTGESPKEVKRKAKSVQKKINKLEKEIDIKVLDQLPKEFSMKGKMEYEIIVNGDQLQIKYNDTEENILVSLFATAHFVQKLEDEANTVVGKKTFSVSERQGISKTRYMLGNILSSHAKIVARKMLYDIANLKQTE